MCKSVKGAAFFGSTVHVVASFSFFVWFLFDTVISEMGINLWKCVPPETDPGRQVNSLVHYLNLLFKFIYYIALCTTGIYIFRGVERASPRMIKFALLVFAIIQVISLGLFIAVAVTYYEDSSSFVQSQPFNAVASHLTGEDSLPSDPNSLSNESTSNNLDLGSSLDPRNLTNISDLEFQNDGINPVLESPLTSSTTSTTPMSITTSNIADQNLEESTISTTSTTTTTASSIPEDPFPKSIPYPVPPVYTQTPQKMSQNQLAAFVFQIFLVGFNAVGTAIYTTVLIFHLMTL